MLKSKLSSASVVCVDLEKLDRWPETALMFYVFVFGFQGRPQAGAAGPSLLAHPGRSHDDLRVHRCPYRTQPAPLTFYITPYSTRDSPCVSVSCRDSSTLSAQRGVVYQNKLQHFNWSDFISARLSGIITALFSFTLSLCQSSFAWFPAQNIYVWDVNKDHQLASLSVQIFRETCAQSEHRYRCFDPCWWTRHLLLMFGRVSERRTTAQTVWDQEAQMPHLPADASSFWPWPVCDVNEAPALQLCSRTFYYLLLVFLYRARAAFPNESVGQVTRSSVVLFHCDALRKPDH